MKKLIITLILSSYVLIPASSAEQKPETSYEAMPIQYASETTQQLIKEKDERINELKERVEELKEKK